MITVKEAIIVEGKYDKITLSSYINGTIIETNGFKIFKEKEKILMIKHLAEKRGIVILTDSDNAGFKIRNYLKQCTNEGNIKNAYIPEIAGKEKRKKKPSAEGTLGVEGMTPDVIKTALVNAGCTVNKSSTVPKNEITKLMLYSDGFIGKDNSSELRNRLKKYLKLPKSLSANGLLEYLNIMYSAEEYKKIYKDLQKN